MNIVKAMQTTCFPLTNQIFPRYNSTSFSTVSKRKKSSLCYCNSDDDDSESAGTGSASDGDKRKQDLLAQIAMLQTQKVRLTDFLDERSTYLTQFAEDANAEFDVIGENALKELDEAGARIMEKLDGQMQEFEESSEMSKEEIERNEKVLEEFEDQIIRDKNEGLFFKNLQEKSPNAKIDAKMEMEKIKEITISSAGSKLRKNIYLALMSLLALGIANATFTTADVEWRKVAALGLIFLGLLAQFIYEQSLLSPDEDKNGKGK